VLFSFLGYIISNQNSGNLVISAGIIPILVSTLNIDANLHSRNIAKCLTMLDNILYSFNTSINVFTGIGGPELLVQRICAEVNLCLSIGEKLGTGECLEKLDPGESIPSKELFSKVALMRAAMKFVLHLMQSYGSADGMRNLIDSKLPSSLLIIFENSILFGHVGIFGLAVNVMSTFIHNEPTSLTILQEAGIPSAFLKASNGPLSASPEVVSALPNAFGAICLNPSGLEAFLKSNPFKNYFSVLKDDAHLQSLVDTDVPQLVGNSVDEFMRHHPSTKDLVMSTIMETVKDVVALSEGIEPNPMDASSLGFEGTQHINLYHNGSEILVDRVESRATQLIEVLTRFLEGLFQNISHCREFIKRGGIQLIFKLYNIKALPFDFATAGTSTSLSYLVRYIMETNIQETVCVLTESFEKECRRILEHFTHREEEGFFVGMTQVFSTQLHDRAKYEDVFHSLVSAITYIRVLADLFCTHSMSHSKSIIAVGHIFSKEGNRDLVQALSDLLRILIVEKELFTRRIPKSWVDEKAPVDDLSTFDLKPTVRDSQEHLVLAKWNVSMVHHLLSDFPADIMALFSGIQKLLCNKKLSDANQRKSSLDILAQFASVLCTLLSSPAPPLIDKKVTKVIFDFVHNMIYDSRVGFGVSTVQLYYFVENQGIELLFERMVQFLSVPLEEESIPLFEKVCNLVAYVSNEKNIIESPTTNLLVNRQRDKSASDYFDSHKFLVQVRTLLFEKVLFLFSNDAFVHFSAPCQKQLLLTLTQIYEGEKPQPKSPLSASTARTTSSILGQILAQTVLPQADPSRVQMLCEMGFPRAAAELALTRCGNSISRATDFLINNPSYVDNTPTSINANEGSSNAETTAPEIVTSPSVIEATPESSMRVENPVDLDRPVESEMLVKESPLAEMRNQNAKVVLDRILSVLDHINSSLMLVIKSLVIAICKEDVIGFAVSLLEKIIAIHGGSAGGSPGEHSLTVHMRLFATLFSDPVHREKLMNTEGILLEAFMGLLMQARVTDPWLPSLLLILEVYITTSMDPIPLPLLPFEERPPAHLSIQTKELPISIRSTIASEMLRILADVLIEEELLHCALRILVLLTHSYAIANFFEENNGISCLFRPDLIGKFPFQYPLTIMILRHCIETSEVLKLVMDTTLANLLSVPRVKTLDLSNFIKGSSHLIVRDFNRFLESSLERCELSNFDPKANQHYITWKQSENSLGTSTYISGSISRVVEYLVTQLMSMKYLNQGENTSKNELHIRKCYLLQCLTELIVSYPTAKIDVVTISQKRNSKTTPKQNNKNPFLIYVLSELVPRNLHIHEVENKPTQEEKNAAQESTWGVAFISAMATSRAKDVEELFADQFNQIRIIVLDSMVRCLRESIQNSAARPEVRFGKIVSIADLCTRMLNHKTRDSVVADDSQALQIAQLMIEKGIANMFTNVIADLDILHPVSSKVIDSLLKPLEKLSISAKSLGKTDVQLSFSSVKKKTPSSNALDRAFREMEEEGDIEEESALSDLYRHSALGMMDPASDNPSDSDSASDDVDEYDDYSGEDEDMEEGVIGGNLGIFNRG
jgi:E3 ubiquitin-protein ligase HUWE1